MNSAAVILLCLLAAYLLGAIPWGYLISRSRGVDIRTQGSGNIGATNVFRCVGKSWGILTFLCDLLKGFAAAFFLPLLAERAGIRSSQVLAVLCGAAAVAGHNWPVFLRFKGGKGVATSAGVLLGIAPLAAVIGLTVWIVVFISSRYVSLASLTAALVIAVSSWFLYRQQGSVLPATLTALGVLAVYRHKGNIQRLIKGTENRFQFGKGKSDKT